MKLHFNPRVVPRNPVVSFPRHPIDVPAAGGRETSTVQLSAEGQRLSRSSGPPALPIEAVSTVDQLQSNMRGVNLRSISSDEMAHIAGAMERTGRFRSMPIELLVGIAIDTEPPRDRHLPMDVVQHFHFMLQAAEDDAKSEPGFGFAVEYRRSAIGVLDALRGLGAQGS